MNSYEESVIEALRNLIELNKFQAPLADIDVACEQATRLLDAGPEGFVNPDWDTCGYCKEKKPNATQERYSAGCYAGRMCDDCAYRKYRDHCGVDGTPQLTQADVDEDIEPEDYYDMGRDLADYRI